MDEPRATFKLTGDLAGGPPELRQGQLLIGSGARCDLRLDAHFTISEEHARIEWDGEHFLLTDEDPANQTFVNERQAEFNAPTALARGDVVQIGPYALAIRPDGATLRIEVARLLVKSKFVITRSDAPTQSAAAWEHEVCLICNPPDQASAGASLEGKLVLNHPKVSPLHAGISRLRDPLDPARSYFYITDLSPSNVTYLDRRLLRTDEPAELADGSVAQVGPFDLTFKLGPDALGIDVKLSVASAAASAAQPAPPPAPAAPARREVAGALRIFWAKRTREKASPLAAQSPRPDGRVGKARYKWQPTSDLARVWPLTVPLWCVVLPCAALAVLWAATGLAALSPAPLSAAHASARPSARPSTALRASANACTTCHARGASVDEQCASCHKVEGVFVATVTPKHRAAGIGCTACHAEHRGAGFRPGVAPLSADFQPGVDPAATCVGCHDDANDRLYNGRRVATPHRGEQKGRFGYPVSPAGAWVWPGLDEEEMAEATQTFKSTVAGGLNGFRVGNAASVQFHALHVGRVSARAAGLRGDSAGLLSCSSCHKGWGTRLDTVTPRQTCGRCHDGRTDAATGRPLIAADKPDCVSCHVQHVRDKRRKHPLLAAADGGQ